MKGKGCGGEERVYGGLFRQREADDFFFYYFGLFEEGAHVRAGGLLCDMELCADFVCGDAAVGADVGKDIGEAILFVSYVAVDFFADAGGAVGGGRIGDDWNRWGQIRNDWNRWGDGECRCRRRRRWL